MTADLTEFILSRIAEDEAVAEECAKLFPSPWEIADRGWRVRIYSANVPLSEDVGEPGDERTPCVIEVEPTYAHDGWLSGNVEHIARHDPARVLAQCAALRTVVAEHALYDPEHAMNEAEWWGNDKPLDSRQQACSRCGYPREFAAPYPCPTLRALATIWRDHEDYRPEEWA